MLTSATAGRPGLFSAQPGRIGTLELKHRILMGSMHLGIEGEASELEKLKAFYVERARGGAALMITGGAAVLPEGGGDHMFVLNQPGHREQLAELAAAVRDAGGKIALQLFHSGRYAKSSETGMTPLAPSAVPCRLTRETPAAMSADDIRRTLEAFVSAAEYARDAGYDAVEIMASEGYLLNEFLSPVTNLREDEYGGDLEGRMKLSLEIVARMRERVGSCFPILFRLSGDDCMPGSTTRAETLEFAARLEAAGADALNVGIGWHESAVPTVAAIVPPAAFAHIAADIRSAVRIPVIAANRIHTPEAVEELLRRQDADFAAPARPWLADPAFARKALAGDRDGLNVCISCNQACLDHTLGNPPQPVGCLVNPHAGREWEWRQLPPPEQRLQVAVVGGGVAGLSAAVTAAERGHAVTLFEAADELGGQFRLAGRIPGKHNFLETLRYYRKRMADLGVAVKLSTVPTPQELGRFDRVIAATGVKPNVADGLPGAALPHVATYADILSGRTPLGRRIVIVGGGGIGCDIAHYIGEQLQLPPDARAFFDDYASPPARHQRASITLVSRSERVGRGIGPTTRWVLLAELKRLGVQVLKGYACVEITEQGVTVEHDGERTLLEADQVVLCTGQAPQTGWVSSVRDEVALELAGGVGDARELNAARAIREAYELACRL